MQKKKENFRSLRSVTTFALAAAIITGSIYTVAAAVNYSAETEQAVTSDGVELANGDIVYAGLDENRFTHGMIKAVEISVDYNGDVQTVSLAKGTVSDVLERTGITPAYNEVVEPSLSTPVSDNLTVKVYKGKKLSITLTAKPTAFMFRTAMFAMSSISLATSFPMTIFSALTRTATLRTQTASQSSV